MPNDVVSRRLESVTALVTRSSAAWVVERRLKLYMFESIQYIE